MQEITANMILHLLASNIEKLQLLNVTTGYKVFGLLAVKGRQFFFLPERLMLVCFLTALSCLFKDRWVFWGGLLILSDSMTEVECICSRKWADGWRTSS